MQTYETLSIDNVQQYQTFENKHEMNEVIYQYIDVLRADEQPSSVIEVLRFFGRSSLRVKGVSFPKYQTIADAIGKSVSTVKRAVKVLKEYGIIECIPTIKKWIGKSRRKSVNIIRIMATMNRQGELTTDKHEVNMDKPSNVEKDAEPRNYKQYTNNYVLETARATKNAIPTPIYNSLSPFFNAKDLQRLTGVVLRAKTSKVRIESHTEAFTDVLLDVIRRYKERTISNLDGYLYASIKRLSRRLFLTA